MELLRTHCVRSGEEFGSVLTSFYVGCGTKNWTDGTYFLKWRPETRELPPPPGSLENVRWSKNINTTFPTHCFCINFLRELIMIRLDLRTPGVDNNEKWVPPPIPTDNAWGGHLVSE